MVSNLSIMAFDSELALFIALLAIAVAFSLELPVVLLCGLTPGVSSSPLARITAVLGLPVVGVSPVIPVRSGLSGFSEFLLDEQEHNIEMEAPNIVRITRYFIAVYFRDH